MEPVTVLRSVVGGGVSLLAIDRPIARDELCKCKVGALVANCIKSPLVVDVCSLRITLEIWGLFAV